MNFLDKVVEINTYENDKYGGFVVEHVLEEKIGYHLMNTARCDRVMLAYNHRRPADEPKYQLFAIMDVNKEGVSPLIDTVEEWYDDVPITEPMEWIADNLY